MTTDKTPATLATVKHGGCVQLPSSERERFEAWAKGNGIYSFNVGSIGHIPDMPTLAWMVWQAALSAQPSPGGQGEVREQFEAWAKANGLETKLYAANGMYSHPVTRGAWIAWQARAAQPSRGIDGYQGAFYELAGMLGMAAQARSPKEVWETQMRPMLRELIAKNQPQAVAPFEAPSLPEGSREAAMVVLERDGPGRPTVWCDPGVVDLVKALNGAGIATVWSCDGHGHRPAVVGLKDGRQLLVLESVEALQQLAHLWPDINGRWRAP